MFRKSKKLSPADEANINFAKSQMMRVSPAKPLGYLESGRYNEERIVPRCIGYVPRELIVDLMAKDGIFILSKENDGAREVKWNTIKNPNIILLKANDSSAGDRTFIFHAAALKELLTLNKDIALSMLKKGQEIFEDIDDKAVEAFVKLVGRKDFSKSLNLEKSLVDAAFSDRELFFTNTCWSQIKLTDVLNQTFRQQKLTTLFKPADLKHFTTTDWEEIASEYKKHKTIMGSRSSMKLVTIEISQLTQGTGDRLKTLNSICDYINKYPNRTLSTIIRSKNPSYELATSHSEEYKHKPS